MLFSILLLLHAQSDSPHISWCGDKDIPSAIDDCFADVFRAPELQLFTKVLSTCLHLDLWHFLSRKTGEKRKAQFAPLHGGDSSCSPHLALWHLLSQQTGETRKLLREKISNRSYEFIGFSIIMLKNLWIYMVFEHQKTLWIYMVFAHDQKTLWIYMAFDYQKTIWIYMVGCCLMFSLYRTSGNKKATHGWRNKFCK